MISGTKIIAYIDGANLHQGIRSLDWKFSYRRFRIWLQDKYNIDIAYLFIGLVPSNKDLYTKLQEDGYILVYKEVTYDGGGKVKGNCDADIVLQIASDYYENNLKSAILVSSDGDYAGVVKFLKEKSVFRTLIAPNNKCSFLLRKLNIPIVYMDMLKNKLFLIKGDKRKSPQ